MFSCHCDIFIHSFCSRYYCLDCEPLNVGENDGVIGSGNSFIDGDTNPGDLLPDLLVVTGVVDLDVPGVGDLDELLDCEDVIDGDLDCDGDLDTDCVGDLDCDLDTDCDPTLCSCAVSRVSGGMTIF
jgi:hypothetical protein